MFTMDMLSERQTSAIQKILVQKCQLKTNTEVE